MRLNCILVTGAAGSIAKALRPYLHQLAEHVRLSDIESVGELAAYETFHNIDLADLNALKSAVAGCDAVLHFGGIPKEDKWEHILAANISSLYNLYEAVRSAGKARVVFASSNHTTGFYPRSQYLGTYVPYRPDTLYGVFKCFGECLAQLYFDKFHIETLSIRIGSFREQPEDQRMLAT